MSTTSSTDVEVFSRKQRALSGSVLAYTHSLVALLLGFFVTPIVLSYLGRSAYGLWAIIGQVVAYVGLVDVGIGTSTQTFVGRALNKGDSRLISEIVSTSLVLQLIIAVVCILLGGSLALFLPGIIDLGGEPESLVIAVFVVAVFVRGLMFPSDVLGQILLAYQQISYHYLFTIVRISLRSGLVILLLSAGMDLMSMPVASLLALTVTTLLTLHRVYLLRPKLGFSLHLFRRSWLTTLFRFSSWSLVGRLGGAAIYSSDNLVIGYFLGPAAVSTYVLTRQISEIARQNIYRLGNILKPGITDLMGREDIPKLRSLFFFSIRIYLMLAIIGGTTICLVTERFVTLWVGAENFAGTSVVVVTVAAVLVLCFYHICSIFAVAALDIKTIGVSRISEALLNLVLSVLFITMGMGLFGVAFGTFIACLLTSAWYVPLKASQTLDLRFSRVLKAAFGSAAVLTAVSSLVSYTLLQLSVLNQQSWPSVLLFCCSACALSLLVSYRLVLTADERALTYSMLQRLTRRAAA